MMARLMVSEGKRIGLGTRATSVACISQLSNFIALNKKVHTLFVSRDTVLPFIIVQGFQLPDPKFSKCQKDPCNLVFGIHWSKGPLMKLGIQETTLLLGENHALVCRPTSELFTVANYDDANSIYSGSENAVHFVIQLGFLIGYYYQVLGSSIWANHLQQKQQNAIFVHLCASQLDQWFWWWT